MQKSSFSLILACLLVGFVVAQSQINWVSVVNKFYNETYMKLALCSVCQIPEGTNPISIYDNFAVNPVEQSRNVIYFVTSSSQGASDEIQLVIDQPLTKPTTIVVSTESTTKNTIVLSFTDTYASVKSLFIANGTIVVNSKVKPTFKFKDETLASQINVKYYCDDSCGTDTYVSGSNSNIWQSGGANFELNMRQRIGANYTTFMGCQKSTKWSVVSTAAVCNNGETELTLSIVLPVVLGGGFLACICCCLLGMVYCVLQLL